MPPYEKHLIEQTAKLSEENNKILRKLQDASRWSRFFSILKWIIIIGLTVGAYYYVQPYLEVFIKAYQSFQGTTGGIHLNIPGISGASSTPGFIKSLLGL